MARWIKYLPHRHKDWSSNPPSPCENEVNMAATCNPGVWEAGNPWGQLAS